MTNATERTIQKFQFPTNQAGVHCFRPLCDIHHQFVPGFSKLETRLNKKPLKEEQKTFPTLVEAEKLSSIALKKCSNQPLDNLLAACKRAVHDLQRRL